MRLSDEQLEALFCGHWEKTHDLVGALRMVIRATTKGRARAYARQAGTSRRLARSGVGQRLVERAQAVQQARPILARFARASGVKVRDIVDRYGGHAVDRVRYEAMWLLRQPEVTGKMSHPAVGMAVGGRSHSDSIRAERKVEARIAADPTLRRKLLRMAAPAKGRAA